ncbi:ribosome-associated GTPase EngA [Candidatus Saccharibacteria bacterium]|nr:ribosome-associated GTPase EngA [Candidatus Saccharibacteria bacterium]
MSSRVPIVAIVGRANVGKSSLFNAIIGRRETIVAKEPGTTRDSIYAKASYDRKDFWLVDTAGMKSAEDEFELSIQDQIKQAADSATLIVVVVEADVPPTEEDRRVAKLALKSRKPVILVVNKIDKNLKRDLDGWRKLGIKQIMPTSATQKRGLDDLLSAIATQLPQAKIGSDSSRIHLSLLGRPNVGKSSLFNALAKKQQAPWDARLGRAGVFETPIPLGQAIVAEKAGTTRDVNRAIVRFKAKEIELMDTAGIRRSGKIERGVEQFSILRALAAIEQSDISLLIMDGRELNVQLDQKIAGLIKDAGNGLILVVSKWDQVEKDSFTKDHLAAQIAESFNFVPWAPLIFTSATTGQNVAKIFDLVLEIAKSRGLRFKTPELNRWLQHTVNQHPPAGLRGKLPKLNYIVQEDNSGMPSFKVFGSKTKFLHWSYKRYLEKSFRAVWPLNGTPLKFWFIDKK